MNVEEKQASYRKKYKIDPTFKFNGFTGEYIEFYGEGEIICGRNSYIGDFSTCQASTGRLIQIGEDCAISHNVRIYTSSYVADQDFSIYPRKKKDGNVIIGNGVWIGVNVFIGPNVKIGDNAVIGANSVVTMDVPACSIVGGSPARIIRFKNMDDVNILSKHD